ncbi:MAG: thioredoxin [Clostridia bacterium]|nr:thioredoxin [Clostridia bacterium]
MAVAITNENFEALVLKGDKPVILDFWAEWCGPCRMMTPVIDELAEENPDLLIGKVNVDKNMELALRFGITSIPTLIAFRDGDVVGQAVGVRSKEEVLALLG